ncbi:MAG: porin family protein [Gemmatimonadota bacterium]|nr:porin family protein [Gemmatimonadota bacterium]
MRPAIRLCSVALIASAILAPRAPLAQRVGAIAPQRSFWLGAGWAFPSGGDWSDTYGPGPAAALDERVQIDDRWALRAGLSAAGYMPQDFRGHAKGPSYGSTFALTAGLAYTVKALDGRPYLIAGAGAYAVSGTWLTAVNTIAPYKTQIVFGLEQGVGFKLGGPWFIEARHHVTFRPERNWARFVPITIGYRF